MNIDLEHLHHWMCAIRSSEDPIRTLDAFWKGQINSKLWLIENLKPFVDSPASIDIHGGWVGVLASLMFQSSLPVKSIRTIDLDPTCQETAVMMNKVEEMQGRFTAMTADMCAVDIDADVVINTSCEHITQEQYELWLSKIPSHSLIVLQSNNYNISEHIRTANSLEEFKQQSNINVLWASELELPLYSRWMIVGKKNV
jgi:hypothetical protein